MLVATWLPGELAQGRAEAHDPGVHRQAGDLLRRFHHPRTLDAEWSARARDRMLRWLDTEHRIAAEREQQVRDYAEAWPSGPVEVSPTHGDFQARNWLVDRAAGGQPLVRVIDFGRFDWRPPMTDLGRMVAREWRGRPDLEEAFFEGYGPDPREDSPRLWAAMQVAEAVGTATWAYQVDDEPFEVQGHRMLAEALEAARH